MAEENTSTFNSELASTSFDEVDEDDAFEADLLEKLDSSGMCKLREHFFCKEGQKYDQQRKLSGSIPGYKYSGLSLNRDEFIEAMESAMGAPVEAAVGARLFGALDAHNRGLVWWEEVLDYLIDKAGRRDRDRLSWQPLEARHTVHHLPHCKREPVLRVLGLRTASSFCYLAACRLGRVGLYGGRLEQLEEYVLPLGATRRRRLAHTWLTDALHLPDAAAVLYLASDRSLLLYDASCLVHTPLCVVSGMRNVAECACYAASDVHASGRSTLYMGDDHGNVITLVFHQPRVSLFRKKHPDKLDRYYWVELEQQTEWVSVRVDEGVHAGAVRQLAYCPDNDTLVSCSHDPAATVVIRHAPARRAPYIFRLARGVRCFHLERRLKLLATGSSDCVVRLWNPVVTNQPTASLFGHAAAVVDVLVMPDMDVVFSCSTDGVVKAWDVWDQCCVQTVSVRGPLELGLEHGALSLAAGGRCLLLAGGCHVATVRMRQPRRPAQPLPATPPPLPPPSREHRPAVPSPWQAAEARGIITPDSSVYSQSSVCGDSESGSPSQSPSPPPPSNHDRPETPEVATSSGRMPELPPPPVLPHSPGPPHDLHSRRALHERRIRELRPVVGQCAPHLALALHEPVELRLSPALPPPPGLAARHPERTARLLQQPERLARARLLSPSSVSVLSARSASSSDTRK
ncbi:uncharacterized protein LOC126263083 [Schistocerca nitens]|uniref:uncharacterized protein LOC126263083 n=1 Tax=Schistocerca nitens TaxID=7011 RepID=UPI00211763D1|nr:uncharacterized protein LOC126263083 [Schistocerca nitens]